MYSVREYRFAWVGSDSVRGLSHHTSLIRFCSSPRHGIMQLRYYSQTLKTPDHPWHWSEQIQIRSLFILLIWFVCFVFVLRRLGVTDAVRSTRYGTVCTSVPIGYCGAALVSIPFFPSSLHSTKVHTYYLPYLDRSTYLPRARVPISPLSHDLLLT